MTLRTDLYALFDPLITETIIWADSNAPRPALPYVTMKVMSMSKINRDHYADSVATDGNQSIKGDREFTLSIQRFGPASVESLGALSDSMRKTTTIDRFIAAKLPVVETLDVVDVAALLDKTQIEPRAAMDVRIRMKSSLLDQVGYIDTVVINTDYDGDIGEVSVSLI